MMSAAAKAAIQDSDWEAALRHAVSTAPAERLAERLYCRMRLLPESHHHRYAFYEQVSAAALERDSGMAAAQLRVPPKVVQHISEAKQQLVSVNALCVDSQVVALPNTCQYWQVFHLLMSAGHAVGGVCTGPRLEQPGFIKSRTCD